MSETRAAWIELTCTVLVPTVVLVFGTDVFGPVGVLLVGLAAPLAWSAWTIARERRVSAMGALSMVGVVASGAIGLLQLDTRWFAWKEASLGVVFAAVIAGSAATRWPVVGLLLDRLLVAERVREGLARAGTASAYDRAVRRATIALGAISLLSALATWFLAAAIVRAPAGTETFASEVGFYTGWSFPVVTLPSMVLGVVVLRRLLGRVEELTGVAWDELLPPLDGGTGDPPPTDR